MYIINNEWEIFLNLINNFFEVTDDFNFDKEKENFILKNKHKYSFQEIFINNGICLELKLLKVI